MNYESTWIEQPNNHELNLKFVQMELQFPNLTQFCASGVNKNIFYLKGKENFKGKQTSEIQSFKLH